VTAVLLVVVLVLVAAGVGSIVVMRRNGDPRGAGSSRVRGIDPFTVNEPWRRFVQDALKAQTRFGEVVAAARPGPLRDRLAEIGRALDDGVATTWATARQGQVVREARRRIDTNEVNRRLATFRSDDGPDAERTVRSLEAQLDSAARLDAATASAESRLRLLQAQLDEAVARAAELSTRAGDIGELAGVESSITEVTDQMEALRLALEETGRAGGTPGN
jgi:hypothetical protein